MASSVKQRQEDRGHSISDYHPLVALIVLMLLAASALQIRADIAGGMTFMHHFTGFFLVVYAMFKIFDLNAFADGFQMYDLLAHRVRLYAYVYPFVELVLGLAYLSFASPPITYALTILVFGFGTLGVLNGLRQGLDLDCPCMGSILRVPLSTVSLVENVAMCLMATLMLIARFSRVLDTPAYTSAREI